MSASFFKVKLNDSFKTQSNAVVAFSKLSMAFNIRACILSDFFVQVYHPNIDLEGHICDGLRKAWKPQYDITFCAYAWLNLFVDPNPLDPLNHKASSMMRENEKGFDSLVRRSLAGETLKIDVQRDGSDVKEVHKFPSQSEMNAIRPDSAWTQLFPR